MRRKFSIFISQMPYLIFFHSLLQSLLRFKPAYLHIVFIALLVFCSLAAAQEKPAATDDKQKVAVYMAGEEPPGLQDVHKVMGGELARVISQSEKYSAVDRTEAILQQLAAEHKYQRSGAVDDNQIKALGKQFGVQFLCVSEISRPGDKYYLNVRLVDVETAVIQRSATANSHLGNTDEMMEVAQKIATDLINSEKIKEQLDKERRDRRWKKKAFIYSGIGLDVLGAGLIGYGLYRNNDIKRYIRSDRVEDAKSATTGRNAAYIAGSVLLLSGISVHIIF